MDIDPVYIDPAYPAYIDPARLAFDIDGVIADTMGLFIRIAREDYGITVRFQDMTRYILEECLDLSGDLILEILGRVTGGERDHHLRPLPGAPELITRLAKTSGGVRFITARTRQDNIAAWLADITGLPADRLHVTATGTFDKREALQGTGVTWFVEDRLETCLELYEAGITPILFRQPWNRQPHPFAEISGCEDLVPMIDFSRETSSDFGPGCDSGSENAGVL
ncbi:MAG: haloacid dehalogenase [Desulfobacterales bacterium]|nr:MAG: haloacid dehalogenase [Desulfobacterales bacterium]